MSLYIRVLWGLWTCAAPLAFAVVPAQECDQALVAEGLQAYEQADYEKAVARLLPAVSQGEACRGYREAAPALGMSYYFRGRYAEALPLLELSIAWAPQNVEIAYVLGICYLRQRDAGGARRAFARMFGVPPESARGRLLTARLMIRERMEDLASGELQAVLELDPKLPEVHFLLGELAIFRGDPDAGIAELEKELSLNPAHAMAWYRLGDAYTRKEMWDQAVPPLQKSIWLNPDFSSPYILLGKVYHRKGQMKLAEGLLKRALAMDPNNAGAHYLLGTVYKDTDRMGEAKTEFDVWRKIKQ